MMVAPSAIKIRAEEKARSRVCYNSAANLPNVETDVCICERSHVEVGPRHGTYGAASHLMLKA
jgi:hypothetical protein